MTAKKVKVTEEQLNTPEANEFCDLMTKAYEGAGKIVNPFMTWGCTYGIFTYPELVEEIKEAEEKLEADYTKIGKALVTIYRVLPEAAELEKKIPHLKDGKDVLEHEMKREQEEKEKGTRTDG